MKEKIKRIWNIIFLPIWYICLFVMVGFSIWSSIKHAHNDDAEKVEKGKLQIEIGGALMLNICQRDSVNTIKQANSIFNIEVKRIVKNVYNTK